MRSATDVLARRITGFWCLAAVAMLVAGCPRASGKKPPPPRGELRVVVEPAAGGGEVYVNDELAGIVSTDGTVTIKLVAAKYRVRVERDAAYAVFRIVDVPAPPSPAAELRVRLRERLE